MHCLQYLCYVFRFVLKLRQLSEKALSSFRVTGKGTSPKPEQPKTSGKGRNEDANIDESDLLASAALAANSRDVRLGNAFGSVALSGGQRRAGNFLQKLAKRYVPVAHIARTLGRE
jgi:hypothetical protein